MIRYNPDIHHRHSIRLREYDYSVAGAYFVTVCAQNRECMFGEIVDGKMKLNDAGRMVESIWENCRNIMRALRQTNLLSCPTIFTGSLFS